MINSLYNFFSRICIWIFPILLIGGSTFDYLVYSSSMDKDVDVKIIVPNSYVSSNYIFHTVLLLHGYGGNHEDWSKNVDLEEKVDQYQLLIVCPDGSKNSWYLDSPVEKKSQYETFIIQELIPWLKEYYRIARLGITGLSMGGHGSLYLAFRNQGVFHAVSSLSGGVDLTYSTVKWEIANKIGNYEQYPQRWEENSVVNMVSLIENKNLNIFIDCGINDFFIDCNRSLHKNLLIAGVNHHYTEKKGIHNWDYWINNIDDHLQFLSLHLSIDD